MIILVRYYSADFEITSFEKMKFECDKKAYTSYYKNINENILLFRVIVLAVNYTSLSFSHCRRKLLV